MYVVVQGKAMRLWRASDEHGMVLNIFLRVGRDTDAARRFFEQLLKDHTFVPERIVTDQLGFHQTPRKELLVLENVKHVFVKPEARLNNRLERDHGLVRERPRPERCCCQGQEEATPVSRVAIPAGSTRGDAVMPGFHEDRVQEETRISREHSSALATGVSNPG
jgi:DDE domain